MFEDIKLFRCWKLYPLKINKPSRWKRAKMATVSYGEGGQFEQEEFRDLASSVSLLFVSSTYLLSPSFSLSSLHSILQLFLPLSPVEMKFSNYQIRGSRYSLERLIPAACKAEAMNRLWIERLDINLSGAIKHRSDSSGRIEITLVTKFSPRSRKTNPRSGAR